MVNDGARSFVVAGAEGLIAPGRADVAREPEPALVLAAAGRCSVVPATTWFGSARWLRRTSSATETP